MFSAALRCGLIEAQDYTTRASGSLSFSAALRCGLIEASTRCCLVTMPQTCFPQHYAAASLKPPGQSITPAGELMFSAALWRP